MRMISKHISYKESTQSQTATRLGIDNTPTEEELFAMENVANMCFEQVREWYGKSISITSFFRCAELNKAIGGSKTSDHVNGYAIDMDTEKDNRLIFEWCMKNLEYDQLIWEFGGKWVHISYRLDSTQNRNMVLDASVVNGKTVYTQIK